MYVEHVRDLVGRHLTEVPHLDDLCGLRIDIRQCFEPVVHGEDIDRLLIELRLTEGLESILPPALAATMFDEYSAHRTGGDALEVIIIFHETQSIIANAQHGLADEIAG